MPLRSVLLLALGLLFLFVLASVLLSLVRASRLPAYWRTLAAEPAAENTLRIVALGDSAMQAVGADHPGEGIAGRVASYVQAKLGRPVHLTNLAHGGATVRQRLEGQLLYADLERADIVLVASSNDLEKRVPLETYSADLRRLLAALPADRTVMSD